MSKIIWIEEAHLTFSQNKEGRYDLGDGPGLGFLRSARKIDGGTTVVLTDQVPSLLNRPTIANCANIICFNLVDSKDVWEMGNSTGLDPHQRRELTELKKREVIVRLERYPKAMKLQVDEIVFPKPLIREQARQQSKPILDSMPYIKRAEKKKHEANARGQGAPTGTGGLSQEEMNVFGRIAEFPWELIGDRFIALGLDRDAEGRIRDKLEGFDLIEFVGTVGARYRIFAATDHGKKVARKLGLSVTESTGKGGLIHRSIEEYMLRSLRECFSDLKLKRENTSLLPGVQPDITGTFPDGRPIVLQACCKNSPANEADAFLKLCGLAQGITQAIHRIVAVAGVAVNKGHRNAIERAVRQRNNGRMPGVLVLLDFDSMIATGFDWKDELDGLL